MMAPIQMHSLRKKILVRSLGKALMERICEQEMRCGHLITFRAPQSPHGGSEKTIIYRVMLCSGIGAGRVIGAESGLYRIPLDMEIETIEFQCYHSIIATCAKPLIPTMTRKQRNQRGVRRF